MDYNRIHRVTFIPIDIDGNKIGEPIVVESPLTLEFNIIREPFSEAASASLGLYNLNPETRSQLFYDFLDMENIRQVDVEAGYIDGKFDLIYRGRVDHAFVEKKNVDVILRVESIAGLAVFDPNLNITIEAGKKLEDVVPNIVGEMKSVKAGTISLPDYTFQRPVTLSGNPQNILKQYTKGDCFEDVGVLNVLDMDQILEGDIFKIDEETGLLGVPQKQRTTITVNCMFEPRIKVGQGIEIESRIAPEFNGQYKVYGVRHSGIIGDAVAGQCITTIQLITGMAVFGRNGAKWNLPDGQKTTNIKDEQPQQS